MDYYTNFDNYLYAVIDSLKKLLYVRHPDIFDRIDFDNDAIFLEPLLYMYINQNDDVWLDSIIYGHEKQKKEQIAVFTNATGTVYLPAVGYFHTGIADAELLLETKAEGLFFSRNGEPVNAVFEALLILDNGMEVVRCQHPLLRRLFAVLVADDSEVLFADVYKEHVAHMNRGLVLLEKSNPDHYSNLLKNLKKIILFTGKEPNSFAGINAHCMIFLNVNTWDNELFFVDHVTHEGAHVTFNTITYDTKNELFQALPDSLFADVSGNQGEHGTVYLRFHGLYTYLELTRCFAKLIHDETLSPEIRHEARGRFLFHTHKFKLAIQPFEQPGLLKPEGERWMHVFRERYETLVADFNALKNGYDLTYQQYDFHTRIFELQNPLDKIKEQQS
jgi:hypothetical protein